MRNFLIANALFWLEEYHVDGLRVDAVASMLYLDYSRKQGEWMPNRWGGRENEEAIEFLRELNDAVRRKHPGVVDDRRGVHRLAQGEPARRARAAWASTSSGTWAGCTTPCSYFSKDPIYRQLPPQPAHLRPAVRVQRELRAAAVSHDEVVHGKGSLLRKMPGDAGRSAPTCARSSRGCGRTRARSCSSWAASSASRRSGTTTRAWTGTCSTTRATRASMKLVRGPEPHLPRACPRCTTRTASRWASSGCSRTRPTSNVLAFVRRSRHAGAPRGVRREPRRPVPREGYRVGFPLRGSYVELLNTDAGEYGGSGLGNMGQMHTEPTGWDGQPAPAVLTLPPLSVLWFTPG